MTDTDTHSPTLDLAGIGIGPFNLSIAALLDDMGGLRSAFFDSKPEFSWHEGMALPGARLQTSCLKDLVTGVAPCNRHSFLNYLVQHGRFYSYLSSGLPAISRAEFADYLGWAATRIDQLNWSSPVESVDFRNGLFELTVAGRKAAVRSRHVSLGTGIRPHIPASCGGLMGQRCFHSIDIMKRNPDVTGERVVVIGGGQSGAEVVLALLDGVWGKPAQVSLISRRPNLEPLDETPFTNDYFTPPYVTAFQGLDEEQRRNLVRYQKLASDGISPSTLNALYQRLYEFRHTNPATPPPRLLPGRDLYAGSAAADCPIRLLTRNRLDGSFEGWEADRVILCTGFEHQLPECLAPLKGRLELDSQGRPRLGPDFQMRWDGPDHNHIYAVNQGRYSHGIADSQLSLMCWRSARILNHLCKRDAFPTRHHDSPVQWLPESALSRLQPGRTDVFGDRSSQPAKPVTFPSF
ncbi:lysine N6-hydroxylase [Marinobacter daqiaonensis]|uniref:Lysine N6-hydroxylase n=1 Tax=Marinobacter daqiaonensis TaxID=650891 RepID=A0A1I6I037_9GAMM|nr:SidA/IucD/PvdA family monooxygenase [Marinobacter daqiaonensis]SFR60065.1 lysine N6-hydroxylase [Marinobacter daqiaonensis]